MTDRQTDRPPDQPTNIHIHGETDKQMIDRYNQFLCTTTIHIASIQNILNQGQ